MLRGVCAPGEGQSSGEVGKAGVEFGDRGGSVAESPEADIRISEAGRRPKFPSFFTPSIRPVAVWLSVALPFCGGSVAKHMTLH